MRFCAICIEDIAPGERTYLLGGAVTCVRCHSEQVYAATPEARQLGYSPEPGVSSEKFANMVRAGYRKVVPRRVARISKWQAPIGDGGKVK